MGRELKSHSTDANEIIANPFMECIDKALRVALSSSQRARKFRASVSLHKPPWIAFPLPGVTLPPSTKSCQRDDGQRSETVNQRHWPHVFPVTSRDIHLHSTFPFSPHLFPWFLLSLAYPFIFFCYTGSDRRILQYTFSIIQISFTFLFSLHSFFSFLTCKVFQRFIFTSGISFIIISCVYLW